MTDRLLPFLRRRQYWLAGALLAAWAYWACLPDPLFRDPACTVLEDQAGELLGARIAADGQWRFPHSDSVPETFAQCLVAFEDKRFWQHPGVDPVALCRAMYHNLRAGRVVSGGSTLTMQVVRLARKGRSRSLYEKLVEAVWATRLELGHSKREILALYASNAPFGGNVVGLDAAAWKYYGRPPAQLSWAEAATLAVLPNSPSLIHPGRNRQALRQKRDALLARLAERGVLDSTSAYLAQLEPLPERPLPLPMLAPHLLDRVQASGTHAGAVARTTLRAGLQRQMSQLLQRHHQHLLANGIANGALLVLDVPTGDVLAYVGNVDPRHGAPNAAVDVVPAPRSTGSILKPFLYASMLHQGEALPNMLVPDVPSQFGGYTPKNYDLSYSGALPFREALAKSLNVPFVQLLSRHGVPKLHHFLQAAGIGTLRRGPEHYGLSLILGGAEASLWDLAGTYASMARVLRQYPTYSGRYDPAAFHAPNYLMDRRLFPKDFRRTQELSEAPLLSASAVWHTFEAMVEVARPEDEAHWRNFSSAGKIAWKTGTSFGFRDAWAIGVHPDYVVAVWVGNASGEGRAGLLGMAAAAPVLFDAFHALGARAAWFDKPYDDMAQVPVCPESGHRVGPDCPEADTAWIPKAGLRTAACPYHRRIHLDPTGQYRVHADCESPSDMLPVPFLVLPPAQEQYYRQRHAQYRALPPYRADCWASLPESASKAMELTYPKGGARIFVPKDLDGTRSAIVFEAAHRQADAAVYWHLDNDYLGQTRQFHEMALAPGPGWHLLVLVDGNGERLEHAFEIVGE